MHVDLLNNERKVEMPESSKNKRSVRSLAGLNV